MGWKHFWLNGEVKEEIVSAYYCINSYGALTRLNPKYETVWLKYDEIEKAYNEALDSKITEIVSDWGAIRKKMFGGTCYLLKGNMMCGVYKDSLVLRLGEKQTPEVLSQPYVKPFDIVFLEKFAEFGGNDDPPLLVYGMFMLPIEHPGFPPFCATLYHLVI